MWLSVVQSLTKLKKMSSKITHDRGYSVLPYLGGSDLSLHRIPHPLPLQKDKKLTDYQSVYSQFFLSFGTNDVTDFPKVTRIISPPNCHLRFSIVVLETSKFKKKGLAM